MSAREVTWAELCAQHFDLAEILPLRPDGAEGGADLFLELARLEGLGDAARFLFAAERGAARIERFAELERTNPALARATAPWLAQLALDDELFADDWHPDRDLARDGLALAEPWSRALVERAPWNGREGTDQVFQAAALMRADLDAIKDAECDFPAHFKRVGEEYDDLHAVPDSHLVGTDSAGKPFAALSFEMKVPLPFPFGSYRAVVHMLHRLDARGRLVTDVYSNSADFLWLAGRDVCLPLHASDGTWIGTLVVRRTGFDLKGVPDGDSDRRSALRAGLGNLKRDAEAKFAQHGGTPRTIADAVPPLDVR